MSSLGASGASGPDLTGAQTKPFIAGQLFQAHGTASADFIRADADFRAHAELAAIGKAGGSIPIHGGGVDFGEELVRAGLVAGHNGVGVGRAVMTNMLDGLGEVIHDANIEDVVVVFGEKILVGGRFQTAI